MTCMHHDFPGDKKSQVIAKQFSYTRITPHREAAPMMETTPTDVMGAALGAEESTMTGMVMQQPVDEMAQRKGMKVMVAIDESEGSFYALRWALDHISGGGREEDWSGEDPVELLTLVHVRQPFQHTVFPVGPGGAAFYATTSVVESVKKAQEENAALILSRAQQMCKEKMVKADTLVLSGDPKDMICQATEQMHTHLLVVGSRGLGKIKRAFLGSVSDYCAHHANCPILIVKPPKGTTTTTST